MHWRVRSDWYRRVAFGEQGSARFLWNRLLYLGILKEGETVKDKKQRRDNRQEKAPAARLRLSVSDSESK